MEPFKNLISKQVALNIAKAITRNYPDFDQKGFIKGVDKNLTSMELKERVSYLSGRLEEFLPDDLKKSLMILKGAIKQSETDTLGLSGFSVWPLTDYVARYGLAEFNLSMSVLKEMTKVFTSEWAVRAYFIHDEKKTLEIFKSWENDKNEHVRRLVSEGSRPLLPWGQKLHSFVKDPNKTWDFLDKLKNDESMYVRKSVANHVNDHSKNHPDMVVNKLLEWSRTHKGDKNLEWVIRHASRTLIKNGHQKSFLLHGVESGEVSVLKQKILTKKVILGEFLQVEVEMINRETRNLKIILDHEVHLLKSNNTYNIKCFKGKVIELSPLEKIKITLKIPLRKVTTRTYYSGKHFWNIKINGKSEEALAFTLIV